MSGINLYADTYTGTNMWVDSITGVSAHFIAYTGNKITATSILVAPNIQGGYATFNQAITGTTINLLTSVKSPLLSGTTHSGSNAFFSSITGSSNIYSPLFSGSFHTGSSAYFTSINNSNITGSNAFFSTITGTSAFLNSLSGSNAYFTNFYAGNITFPSSETITNLTVSNLTGTNIFATKTINSGSNIVLNGVANSMTGAHIFYYTSDGATYPTRQYLQLGHDNTNITFDQYYDGSNWIASSTTASYAINKNGGNLLFRYAPATGANTQVTTPTALELNSSGQIQVQTSTYSSSTNSGALIV